MTVQEKIRYLKATTNKEVSYDQDTKLYYIIEDGMRINISIDIIPIPYGNVENTSRFEIIEDVTGRWMRDKKTGIEYSCKIGLGLIK